MLFDMLQKQHLTSVNFQFDGLPNMYNLFNQKKTP